MDLRQRDSVERWRRTHGPSPRPVTRLALGPRMSWRRVCPPEFVLLGCCGLIAWLALVAWTAPAPRAPASPGLAAPGVAVLAAGAAS